MWKESKQQRIREQHVCAICGKEWDISVMKNTGEERIYYCYPCFWEKAILDEKPEGY